MNTFTPTLNPQQNLFLGKIINWQKEKIGIKGKAENGFFQISVFNDQTLRIQVSKNESFSFNPYSVIEAPSSIDFTIDENEKEIKISTSKITVVVNISPYFLTFLDSTGEILNQDDPAFSVSWLGTEITQFKKLQKNEKFIGLGEKTGGLNRAGKAYTNWNTDYFAYGVGDDPLYMSIPFYIGLHHEKAYGIFFDNTHKTIFNFGASNNRFSYFSADDGDMDYYFFHDHTVAGIIQNYTSLTGKMKLPPLWSLGYQQCRYSYYPESEVMSLSQNFRDRKIPADVIYLDIHHMEKYKVFTFDGEKFPDPQSMISRLKENGFKVVVIMDPGIKVEEQYIPYREGKAQDLFVKYPDGEIYEGQVWPGWCAFPDFTKEETRKWWAEKMSFYKDAGVKGYWTDMNEPASWGQFTPNLLNFHYEGQNVSHRKARNIYGMQMARSAQEGSLQQDPNSRPFILTRAGFSGIQRYAAAWTGDNVASDEHMLAGIRLVNSLSLSGVAYSGYDVGGFCGEASKSLFARWMSIATFAPLFRSHSMINTKDAEPWSFGEEVEEVSKNYIQLRYRLLPTLYSSFYQSTLTGLPIVKPLAVDYPFDENIYKDPYQNEYICCESFLVAPTESTREISKVYLPEGNWYYLWNDKKIKGNQVIYQESPINYLPVYVKEGSIIAMQSDIQYTADSHDKILRLHLYNGSTEGILQYYEDDGVSFEYLENSYYLRKIIWNPKEQSLIFDKIEGIYPSSFDHIKLYLHGFEEVSASIHSDQQLEVKKENFAFIDKISDFDPFPDSSLPFQHIENLSVLEFANHPSRFHIKFSI
jgi:alpha-glucosidase